MTIPLLDLCAQYNSIRSEVQAAVLKILESQQFILGSEVEALEEEIAAYSQCRYGVGVSSGTDALLIALMSIDIKPGDEVITSPYTFFATAGCAARLGAKPVFVDIDLRTFNIDVSKIEAAITPRTRAIIPVHLYGQMAEMDTLMGIAQEHKLYVIEDAAQAIGAEYKGRRAGGMGHLGCFSFFPSKNLGGIGDGGMVVTNDSDLARRLSLLRSHGAEPKYYHRLMGGNFRLDAIQAAVLRVKLKYLDAWTQARQNNGEVYRRLFIEAGLCQIPNDSFVILPFVDVARLHIYNQFVIRVKQRDSLMAYQNEQKIGTDVYYPIPLHLQEIFSSLEYHLGDFPASECAAAESLALPIYPELTYEMQREVVETIRGFYSGA